MASILIVEDDAMTREILRLALEDVGHTPSEASSAAAGSALLRVAPVPMIVLLDQLMPGLSGEGLLEQVASGGEELRRHAYVLLTAGAHRLSPRMVELLEELNVPLVAKPFDFDTILAAVDAAALHLGQLS